MENDSSTVVTVLSILKTILQIALKLVAGFFLFFVMFYCGAITAMLYLTLSVGFIFPPYYRWVTRKAGPKMARTTAKLFRKMIGKNDDNEDSGVGPLKSDGTPDLRFKSNRE